MEKEEEKNKEKHKPGVPEYHHGEPETPDLVENLTHNQLLEKLRKEIKEATDQCLRTVQKDLALLKRISYSENGLRAFVKDKEGTEASKELEIDSLYSLVNHIYRQVPVGNNKGCNFYSGYLCTARSIFSKLIKNEKLIEDFKNAALEYIKGRLRENVDLPVEDGKFMVDDVKFTVDDVKFTVDRGEERKGLQNAVRKALERQGSSKVFLCCDNFLKRRQEEKNMEENVKKMKEGVKNLDELTDKMAKMEEHKRKTIEEGCEESGIGLMLVVFAATSNTSKPVIRHKLQLDIGGKIERFGNMFVIKVGCLFLFIFCFTAFQVGEIKASKTGNPGNQLEKALLVLHLGLELFLDYVEGKENKEDLRILFVGYAYHGDTVTHKKHTRQTLEIKDLYGLYLQLTKPRQIEFSTLRYGVKAAAQ